LTLVARRTIRDYIVDSRGIGFAADCTKVIRNYVVPSRRTGLTMFSHWHDCLCIGLPAFLF